MDDVIFTENVHRLIEKSNQYRTSMTSFFQASKHGVAFTQEWPENRKNRALEPLLTDQINQRTEAQPRHLSTLQHNNSAKNKNAKTMFPATTFMINLAGQNLEHLPTSTLQRHRLIEVQLLDLSDNRLRAFPKEIYTLENLRSLNLNSNFIKQLHTDLYQSFPVLQNFSISNNLVPTIHHSIENWAKHLIYLDISNNRIESIATITKMCGLRTLLIQSNEFKVLTYTLSKLSMLRELSLDWFKYTNPPMASVQRDLAVLNKLQILIRQSQIAEIDGHSAINLDCDDLELEEGVSFKEFVTFFSESASGLPLHPSNPQGCESVAHTQIIHRAAIEQDIGVLMFLIREYRKLIDDEDANGYTPLGLAIKEEKYFSAKTLIFNGANVNRGRTTHGNILNLSIVKGQIHMIADLLQHNADYRVVDPQGNGPLHYCVAVFDRDPKIYAKTMSMLLKHGVDPNLVNRDGWTPLHLAAKKGVNEAIEAMILHNLTSKNKFDFSQRGGKKGQTCLHIAAQNNNFELCFLLLSTIGALCRNSQDQFASDSCKPNSRLYKLLKKYEYQQTADIVLRGKQFEGLYDFNQVKEDEMDENIHILDAIQHKTMMSNSLWEKVPLSKQCRMTSQQRQGHQVQRMLDYSNQLLSYFTRAKYEAFKEDLSPLQRLATITVIHKILIEITSIHKRIQNLNSQLGALQQATPLFTPSQVHHLFYQLLASRFRLASEQSQPMSPRRTSQSSSMRSNKFLTLRESYQLPNCFLQPSVRKSASNYSSQVQQPSHEISQECPTTPPNNNESYQDESMSAFDEMVRSKQKIVFDSPKDIFYAESLAKLQGNKLVSCHQKGHLTQLVQQGYPIVSFEAFQSLSSLQRLPQPSNTRFDPLTKNMQHQMISNYIQSKIVS